MDSNNDTSAGSGAGVCSCSTSRLENGASATLAAGFANNEAGIADALKIGLGKIGAVKLGVDETGA